MPGVVQSHKTLLLLSLAHILDGISAPYLPLLDHSAWWHHAIRCDDGALLQDGALEDD